MVRSGPQPGDQRRLHRCCSSPPSLLLFAAWRLEQGRRPRQVAVPALAGPRAAGARRSCSRPAAAPAASAQLNLYIWSNYIAPGDGAAVRGAPRRARERRPLRQQRGAAGQGAGGQRRTTTSSAPRTTPCRSCVAQGLLRAAGPLGAAPPREPRPALPGPAARSRQPLLGPLLLGHDRHRLPQEPRGDRWTPGARSGTRATAGRILMLDDARETFGAALKRKGLQPQHHRPRAAAPRPSALLDRAEAARARLQLLELRGRAALGRRVAGPGLERPVRAGHGPGPRHRLRDPQGGLEPVPGQPGHPARRARIPSWPTPSSTS